MGIDGSMNRYLKYLNDFTDHFGLRENIRFRTAVERLRKCPKSGKWIADLKGNRWSPPHRMYGELPEEDPNEPVYVEEFDGVAVCTGTNQWANLPCFEGTTSLIGLLSMIHICEQDKKNSVGKFATPKNTTIRKNSVENECLWLEQGRAGPIFAMKSQSMPLKSPLPSAGSMVI